MGLFYLGLGWWVEKYRKSFLGVLMKLNGKETLTGGIRDACCRTGPVGGGGCREARVLKSELGLVSAEDGGEGPDHVTGLVLLQNSNLRAQAVSWVLRDRR